METGQGRKMRVTKSNSEPSSNEAFSRPMPSLPKEVINDEILTRLPVKSLVRAQSVCKSWKSLITSDPRFALLQLKSAVENKSDRLRVLLWHSQPSLFCDTLLLDKISSTNDMVTKRISIPMERGELIVAVCDGLVCVQGKNYSMRIRNMFTGETRGLQEPRISLPGWWSMKCGDNCWKFRFQGHVSYGLGYDHSSDDYKLVRMDYSICKIDGNGMNNRVIQIYSFRTGRWREIVNAPLHIEIRSCSPGVPLNGTLYWVVFDHTSPDPWKVLAFDLANESFRLLDVPPRSGRYQIRIVGLGEKLGVYYRYDTMGSIEFYLVKEYDSGESQTWTNYKIRIPVTIVGTGKMTPLCMMNGDEMLMAGGGIKLVYNLKSNRFRYLEITGMLEEFQNISFLETLISPDKFKGFNFEYTSRNIDGGGGN